MFSDDHHAEFRRTGLVPLRGAIPAKDAEAMVDRIWEHLARTHGNVRGRPETWTVDRLAGLRAPSSATVHEWPPKSCSRRPRTLTDSGERWCAVLGGV
jgi:hypothetical protein